MQPITRKDIPFIELAIAKGKLGPGSLIMLSSLNKDDATISNTLAGDGSSAEPFNLQTFLIPSSVD